MNMPDSNLPDKKKFYIYEDGFPLLNHDLFIAPKNIELLEASVFQTPAYLSNVLIFF